VALLASWDRHGRLRFAPLDGRTASDLGLAPRGPAEPATLLFVPWPAIGAAAPLERSAALLAALELLGPGGRAAAACLRALPRAARDAVYRAVAARRSRWFGRDASCPAPPAALRGRWLP